MSTIQPIQAKPLKLIPLDCQIRAHGGNGFNSSVIVRPVPNSFAVKYIFDTENGVKILETCNEVQIGMLNDGEYHFIHYNGDSKQFYALTPKFKEGPPYKSLMVTNLGDSFENMCNAVKLLWGRLPSTLLRPESIQ